MRRMFAIVLALVMVLSMAACGGKTPDKEYTKYADVPGLEDGVLTIWNAAGEQVY